MGVGVGDGMVITARPSIAHANKSSAGQGSEVPHAISSARRSAGDGALASAGAQRLPHTMM